MLRPTEVGELTSGSPLRAGHRVASRRVLVVGAVAIAIAAAVASWLVGSRVRSADQAAADAAPPPRSVVTAPVELRVLSVSVVTRGDVVPAVSTAVTGPRPDEDAEAVVTGLFTGVGESVQEGDRVVEVGGRPVFVFEGTSPAYRSLRPGMRGTDVAALQAGLARGGCDAGSTGLFDDAVKECVEQLYADAGYEVVLTSDTEVADLAAARGVVTDAEDALATAQAALDEATVGPSAQEQHDADVAVTAAERELAAAQADRDRDVEDAVAAVDDALADVNAALVAANPAATTSAGAPAAGGGSGGAATGEAASGSASGSSSAAGSSTAGRDDAADGLADALVDVDVAQQAGADAVAAAEEASGSAQAALDAFEEPVDSAAEQAAVDRAEAHAVEAERALADLDAASGATVPLGEFVFVPSLPATIDELNAVVGETADASSETATEDGATQSSGATPLLVLSSAGMQVDVAVNPSDRGVLQAGMAVELLDELSGQTVNGELESIGDELEGSADGTGQSFTAVVTSEDIPEEWSGRNVRVTFTAAATDGEVLAVPLAAVSTGAAGHVRVEVVRENGTADQVEVSAGLSADGFVAVTPDENGALVEGDGVVVGR